MNFWVSSTDRRVADRLHHKFILHNLLMLDVFTVFMLVPCSGTMFVQRKSKKGALQIESRTRETHPEVVRVLCWPKILCLFQQFYNKSAVPLCIRKMKKKHLAIHLFLLPLSTVSSDYGRRGGNFPFFIVCVARQPD